MPDASADWVVSKHGPIEKLSENLWRVQAPVVGIPIDRVMTVIRLTGGDLVIHSAVALEESAMKQLEAHGTPRFLIVPNGFHRLDAPRFKKRYPSIRVIAPKGSTKKIADKVAVDGGFELLPEDARLRVEPVDGTREQEGVLHIEDAGEKTLVFNDLIFNMPHRTGFDGFVLKWVLASSGGPRTSRLGRFALAKDKAKVGAHLERLASLEGITRVIVAHSEMITAEVGATLRAVVKTL